MFNKVNMTNQSESLSSSTLFHFTTKLEYLIDILENFFKPRYCLEELSWSSTDVYDKTEMAYPMVCFCDIPLSKTKNHISTYGNYGIGLSKSWGDFNSLTPIIYTRKHTKTSIIIEDLLKYYSKEKELQQFKNSISELIMYIKPYRGKMFKKRKYIEKKFYDEREWRWIPEIISSKIKTHLSKEEFLDKKLRKLENKKIGNEYSLKFDPYDIKYLILKSELEIKDFIFKLENIKSNYYDPEIIKILTSRIITTDQIVNDF